VFVAWQRSSPACAARAIGLASEAENAWLYDAVACPWDYKRGNLVHDPRGHAHVDAFLGCFDQGYVALALELDVRPDRINTTADFQATEMYGIHAVGESEASTADVLASPAKLFGSVSLESAIAASGSRRLPRTRRTPHPRQDRFVP
jgi:hypothetical protein